MRRAYQGTEDWSLGMVILFGARNIKYGSLSFIWPDLKHLKQGSKLTSHPLVLLSDSDMLFINNPVDAIHNP